MGASGAEYDWLEDIVSVMNIEGVVECNLNRGDGDSPALPPWKDHDPPI
jgi:hypothetical protein